MLKMSVYVLVVACCLVGPVSSTAFDDDESGCVYNRTVYPDRTEMCQSGNLMRCDTGAWSEIGDCRNDPMPEPVSSGGDHVEGSLD